MAVLFIGLGLLLMRESRQAVSPDGAGQGNG